MKGAIKRILVPLDPSMFAQAATETACRLARKHHAQLAGVAVLDSTEIRSTLIPTIGPYYPMMAEAVQEKITHADHVLKDCLDRFANTCEEQGVPHLQTEYEGIPAHKLLESSIFFDLVVMGLETSFHFETRTGKGDTLDKLLDQTVTPVLAVPATGLQSPDKVLIAFDGSFGASRALHDFVGFAAPYDPEITVVAADQKKSEAEFLLKSAAAFLRSHGYSKVETYFGEKPIAEEVDDSLLENVDLVVAGIHSKKLVKDFFVGSFAKALIEKGRTSLLLSH